MAEFAVVTGSLLVSMIFVTVMAVLYIFSLFGSMFGSIDFTYAEF